MKPNFEQYCHAMAQAHDVAVADLDLEEAAAGYASEYGLKTAVFVDDELQPTERLPGFNNWVWCRNGQAWQQYLAHHGPPDFVSFDHDLAPEHYQDAAKHELQGIQAIEYNSFKQPTGLDCARLYTDFCDLNNLSMGQVAVHCVDRRLGAFNIQQLLNGYLQSKGSAIRCIVARIPTVTLADKARAAGLVLPSR